MPITRDEILRAIFHVCRVLDSDPPSVRDMLKRLRLNSVGMNQEAVRDWLAKELENRKNYVIQLSANPHKTKNRHTSDTVQTQPGHTTSPFLKAEIDTSDTPQTQNGHARARDKKVLDERDEMVRDVSYSETSSSRENGKTTKRPLRYATEDEDICLWVAYARYIGESGITAAIPEVLLGLYKHMERELDFPPRP